MCHQLWHLLCIQIRKLENWSVIHRIKTFSLWILQTDKNIKFIKMIDNHIQMIHCHSSAGKVWKQPKVILLAVIIKQSLFKRCRIPVGFLMDFNWTNSRSGYEYFTNCACEQQRGTKEVETVSLKNVIWPKTKQITCAFTAFTPVRVSAYTEF